MKACPVCHRRMGARRELCTNCERQAKRWAMVLAAAIMVNHAEEIADEMQAFGNRFTDIMDALTGKAVD